MVVTEKKKKKGNKGIKIIGQKEAYMDASVSETWGDYTTHGEHSNQPGWTTSSTTGGGLSSPKSSASARTGTVRPSPRPTPPPRRKP